MNLRTLAPALLAGAVLSAPGPAHAAQQLYAGSFAAEAPGATGSGTITLLHDSVARTLQIDLSFAGLSGTTTTAHIHCCNALPLTGTSGVAVGSFGGASPNVIPFFPLGVTSGSYTHTVDLSLAGSYGSGFLVASGGTPAGAEARLMANLAAGQAYFNIHTSTFGGGEIRAFVTAVPEPGSWALMAGGLALLSWRARRGAA